MKSKVLSIVTSLVLLAVFIIPVSVSAASSTYEFNMFYRVVDGSANNVFHTLAKGKTVTIKGSTKITNSAQGAPAPSSVSYTLYRQQSGTDKEFGTINGGVNKSFSGTFINSTRFRINQILSINMENSR